MVKRLSKIYWPLSVIPKDAVIKNEFLTSKSQKLFLEQGLIKPTGNGTFHILPILQKSIDKCINLLDKYMNEIDGQKVTLPLLTTTKLWEKSGRLSKDQTICEYLQLKDRNNKSFILSPTHEESITSLLAMSPPISYKQLPLKLYQIGSKFRDEFKPRYGLIRTKEFLMKDMYSFDSSLNAAKTTYDQVNTTYEKIFDALELPWIKVRATTNMMGGELSHEYHIPSNIGEDNLLRCLNCNFSSNKELLEVDSMPTTAECIKCPNCNSNTLDQIKGIEIGHTFLLSDKYSKPLNATFLKSDGTTSYLAMGCYGIGVTRLIAAAVEELSENEIRWPKLLAPYKICIIPPKIGSKESNTFNEECLNKILYEIEKIQNNSDDIIIDDRQKLTIGKRLIECKKLGFTKIIVIGNKILDIIPKFELHCLETNTIKNLEFPQLLEHISNNENNKNSILNKICNL